VPCIGLPAAGRAAINSEESRMRGMVGDTARASRRSGCVASLALMIAVSGCSSSENGGGGGSVAIGGGQGVDPVVLDFPVAYVRRPLAEEDAAA
jgi:hypothetical protein